MSLIRVKRPGQIDLYLITTPKGKKFLIKAKTIGEAESKMKRRNSFAETKSWEILEGDTNEIK